MEKYKMLIKNVQKTQINGKKNIYCLWIRRLKILNNANNTPNHLQSQFNLYQNANIFAEIEKSILNFIWNLKEHQKAKLEVSHFLISNLLQSSSSQK